MKLANAEDRFTKIYEWNFWAAKESVSGPGSSLDGTENIRRQLPVLFEKFSVKTVFDAPCGDFNWMTAVLKGRAIAYVGADIVKPLIEKNIALHRNVRTDFRHLDIRRDPFPPADLWICRDCLGHLPIDDIFQVLRRFAESTIPYMLVSSETKSIEPKNYDIPTGDFRPTDLFLSPFLLPEAVLFRFDDVQDTEMCLWSREQIVERLRSPSPGG